MGGVDDEEYAQECYELVKQLKLENIIFTGRVDIVKYMEKLDFTILTSISEGQPLSVLESFAARRPCVTTDVGCCRELLEGKEEDYETAARKLSKYTAVIGRKSGLISSISIEDNIFLFSDKSCFIRQKNYRERLRKLKEQFRILPDIPDRQQELTIKERIMVELLKAYVGRKRIVVLQDVIGALAKPEIEELFAFLNQIKGEMTFLVIAGFEEVGIRHLDRLVLVQNGRTIAMSQLMIRKKGLNQILTGSDQ